MSFDTDNTYGTDPRKKEDVWSDRLLETFEEAKAEVGRERSLRLLLLLCLGELKRLQPLVAAGWRGDERGSPHLDAIRHLCSEIAKAGQIVPPSGAGPEPDELKGG